MLTPFISILPGQIPLMVAATVSIIAYVGMFALPTPGSYLPKVEEVQQEKDDKDEMVFSIQENENDIIQEFNDAGLAPLQSFTLHRMAYQETFMDR